MNQAVLKFIVEVVIPALGAVMGILMPLIVLEVKKLVAAKTKNEQLRGVLDRVTDSAAEIVREVAATTYKELAARAGDGKIDSADQEALRSTALAKLRQVAAKDVDDMQKLKAMTAAAVTSDLLAKIESAYDQMKLARVAAANAVPVAPVAGST